MKYFSILLLLLLFNQSCNSKLETIEIQDNNGNILERFSRKKADFAREGKYEIFDSTGVLLEIANYKNDTLDGQRKIFYENGLLQYIENYNMGQFEGEYLAYYDNGKLKLQGQYIFDVMSGDWKAFYASGNIKEVVHFEDNNENGPFVEYYENGKIRTEGNYLEGDYEHGELKMYDEKGDLRKTMMCNRGICRTTWLRDSTSISIPEE